MNAFRQKRIAQIHIARKALAMDDACYRSVLERVTGKPSCSDMSVMELQRVVEEMQRLGWKASRRRLSPKSRDKKEHTETDKLRALWINIHLAGGVQDGSEAALCAWVKRQTAKLNHGIGYDAVEWVPFALLPVLIEQLKKWLARLQ